MSPSELKDWLETSDSQDSGWSKDNDGKVEEDGEGHESVGHESGRKIVCFFPCPLFTLFAGRELMRDRMRGKIEILEKNPEGIEEDYEEEDLKHMRKG